MYHDKLPDMSAAYAEIQEKAKKKLDPVGKSDGDVDNDGDKDSSDSYLLNRRKVIASKMKKEHHQKDENGKVIEHDDQEEVNEVAPAVAAAGKMALAGAAFAAGEAGAKKLMKKKEKKEVEEAYTVTNADKKGNTPAYQAYKAGKKNVKTGKPLYKAADHMKEEEISPIDSVLSPEELERVAELSREWDAKMEEGYGGKPMMSKGGEVKPPRTAKGAMAYDGPNKAASEARDRVVAKTKAKRAKLKKEDWRADLGFEIVEHHQKDEDGNVIEHEDEADGTPSSVEEAVKGEKLDIKTTGVKNKIEINPEMKTEARDRLLEKMSQASKNVGTTKCWPGYKRAGTQMKKGKVVPKCEKEETIVEKRGLWDNVHARRKAGKPKRKPGDKNYPKTLDVESYTMLDKVEDEALKLFNAK